MNGEPHPCLHAPRARAPSLRAKAVALFALCALAVALSSCDKCGDFGWNKPGACRDYGPPQR